MRHSRTFVAIAVSCLSLACGSDNATDPTTASVVGTWNLTSVNGASLPFTIQAANPKIEVLDQRFTFASAGTFSIAGNNRQTTSAGAVTTTPFTDTGTWTLSGTTVNAHYNGDNSNGTIALSGNTMTIVNAGRSFVFTKQ
jgi:hypothetical protein